MLTRRCWRVVERALVAARRAPSPPGRLACFLLSLLTASRGGLSAPARWLADCLRPVAYYVVTAIAGSPARGAPPVAPLAPADASGAVQHGGKDRQAHAKQTETGGDHRGGRRGDRHPARHLVHD